MEKVVLVLENDFSLENKFYVNHFLDSYEGEKIIFTGLHTKTNEEIFEAVSRCTDIVVQTCFVNGSENQFWQFFKLLRNIKTPKNVYIAFLGENLEQWLKKELEPKDMVSIYHHNIFDLPYRLKEGKEYTKVNFADIVGPYLMEVEREKEYYQTAKERPTGKRVRILGCMGFSEFFKDLPKEADVLDMSKYDPNPKRGVWVFGNGGPVKLVNDCGFTEYEYISTESSSQQVLDDILAIFGITEKALPEDITSEDFKEIIEDDKIGNMRKANMFCEELNKEKRGNRSKIYSILNKFSETKKEIV